MSPGSGVGGGLVGVGGGLVAVGAGLVGVAVGDGPVEPSMVTPKRANTGPMGLAMVRVELPANSSPTGFLLLLLMTMREPESPPALKPPGPIVNCWTKRATARQKGPEGS